MGKSKNHQVIQTIDIERHILFIRDEKVMLDADLAALYQVETKVLVQAMKRNLDRFPEDFMFQLSKAEFDYLRSQNVTSSWGGRRYPPYAFTEQGVAMLSSVLRSSRAVRVNVEIVRAFVRLRKLLESNEELDKRLSNLEKKYDQQFKVVFDTIRELMAPTPTSSRPIGFIWTESDNQKKSKGS
ncbi:ORF6N domain-containing protein [Porticoccus sp. GXU_MW_L64]